MPGARYKVQLTGVQYAVKANNTPVRIFHLPSSIFGVALQRVLLPFSRAIPGFDGKY